MEMEMEEVDLKEQLEEQEKDTVASNIVQLVRKTHMLRHTLCFWIFFGASDYGTIGSARLNGFDGANTE